MLHRSRTKSKNDRRPLGRSKSTNSITRKSICTLHSDPIAAEREAHIAARLSYQRAHGRKSEGMAALAGNTASLNLGPGDRSISRHEFARRDSARSHTERTDHAFGIARQRSIRFAGPNAQPRRAFGSRASDSRIPMVSADDDENLSFGAPGRRARSAFSESRDDDTFLTANPFHLAQMPEERYAFEDDLASMTSSYRRIRKARSMFTTADMSEGGYSFTNDPAQEKRHPLPSRYASLNKETIPAAEPNPQALRGPKSMGFLRNGREQTAFHTNSRLHHDLAIQLAREKFREHAENQAQLKSYPSASFRSRRSRRTESSTGLRKSMRNSSNNSATLSSAFSGDSLSVPKHRSLRKKARNVSRTIKTKLRGIFSRPQFSDEPAEGRDDHVESNDFETSDYIRSDASAPAEEVSMCRGPSRIASLHEAKPFQNMVSRQGSLKGCDYEDGALPDDKSRVTSWADSVTNTATSQPTGGECENYRLSVIKENGTHVSSASPQHMGDQGLTTVKAMTVDSQRIYSALMKRADEMKKREEEARRENVDNMRARGIAPARTSSVDQFGCGQWSPDSPPTIRYVHPEDDVFQDKGNRTNGSRRRDSTSDQTVAESRPSTSLDVDSGNARGSPNPWLKGAGDEAPSMPSPGKAGATSRASSKRINPLTQRSSAFFGSSPSHLFRTVSPFRRALQENMKAAEESVRIKATQGLGTKYLGSLSAISLPDRQPSKTGSRGGTPGIYADSLYSYAEEDTLVRPRLSPHRHVGSLAQSSRRSRHSPIRDVSEASSTEWKTRMSAHISKLEGHGSRFANYERTPSSPQLRPRLGHVREKAEIESPTDGPHSSPKTICPSNETTPLQPLVNISLSKCSQNVISQPRRVTPGVENELPA